MVDWTGGLTPKITCTLSNETHLPLECQETLQPSSSYMIPEQVTHNTEGLHIPTM